MMEIRARGQSAIVRNVLGIRALVPVVLFAILLLQVLYLGPWLFGTSNRADALQTRVETISGEWINGTDAPSGFALSTGTRAAIITPADGWQIEVIANDVQGLTPIKPSPDDPGWGDLQISASRHALLKAVTTMSETTTEWPEGVTKQYVYLGTRYFGYGVNAERAASGTGAASVAERAWFVGEVAVPSGYRIPMILNLVLLAVSLPSAISSFVISAQAPIRTGELGVSE